RRVTLVRTPDRGIQPQAAVDSQGLAHLIYYKGDAGGGNVFYVRQEPGQDTFSKPLPVNSHSGNAIATGTIRGAQLAIGKDGRVRVAWNGGKGAASLSIAGKTVTPPPSTRLTGPATALAEARHLNTLYGLDGRCC